MAAAVRVGTGNVPIGVSLVKLVQLAFKKLFWREGVSGRGLLSYLEVVSSDFGCFSGKARAERTDSVPLSVFSAGVCSQVDVANLLLHVPAVFEN